MPFYLVVCSECGYEEERIMSICEFVERDWDGCPKCRGQMRNKIVGKRYVVM